MLPDGSKRISAVSTPSGARVHGIGNTGPRSLPSHPTVFALLAIDVGQTQRIIIFFEFARS